MVSGSCCLLLFIVSPNSFQQALDCQPSSAECHLNLAHCLSQSPVGDKKRSHNLLLKVNTTISKL